MKLTIKRACCKNSMFVDYEVDLTNATLLEALTYIKTNIDPTLTYDSGCRSGVCGSCALRVNSKEVLSCSYKVKDGDVIEHLDKMEVIKDLVVDQKKARDTLKRVKSWINKPSNQDKMAIQELKQIERQSDCILCSSCFSSCPVFEVDKEFLGPFALTRSLRYVNDTRCEEKKQKIDVIQNRGVWDCTLCGECTLVCPQGIDPKNDILILRSKSVQFGYSDPSFGFEGGISF